MGGADKANTRIYVSKKEGSMKVAIYSTMLSLHQTHVADELYKICGEDFRFFELRKNADVQKASFVDIAERPYLVKVWESDFAKNEAMNWALSADTARFSNDALSFPFLKARLDKNLLSFEAGERWLKKGLINLLSPRLLKSVLRYHFYFRNKPFYKLCASAYAANDQYLLGTFLNKCYKWGYFTKEIDDVDLKQPESVSQNADAIPLMWCARFLNWKHPELPVKLAVKLKAAGYQFVIDMYGDGVELKNTKALAERLKVDDVVRFMGVHTNDEIQAAMRQHRIFLFTSDRQEGWGAVLNEAMSNGCTVVASNEIGSTPYLIDDGKNGLVFKSNSIDSLFEKVTYLIDHPSGRMEMAIEAYKTMKNIWSPHNAALNFIQLSKDLLNGYDTSIEIGPCSKANQVTF